MPDNIRDYSSIYNIKEFMLEQIAPKYFNMDDTSLMNVGLLGFVTDAQSTTAEDVFNTVSRYITESLPDKARLPEFIYSHAASYGITDLFAYCAKMPVFLFIKESDILTKGKRVGTSSVEFIIDSNMTLFVEDVPFSIPHNIIIRSTQYRDIYNHQSVYDVRYKNDVANLTTPYIKTIKTMVGRETYVMLAVDVYQYTKIKAYENIITNNKLNIPYVDAQVDGKICNFEVLYKDPKTKQPIQLQKFNQSTPPSKTPFVYYKLIDESTLRFSFSNDDRYFIPVYNSELFMEIFITEATRGNFPWYKGNDVVVTTSSDDPELDYNNDTVILATIRGDSVGGKDKLTLEDTRRLTLEKRISVSSYTTDNDLNMFFLNYTKIHATEAMFIKQRDDFSDRIYGCYSILKNANDIFPTNTLNLRIAVDDVDTVFNNMHKYIIKAGSKFRYTDSLTLDWCRKVNVTDTDQVDFEYISVPLISIAKKPNNVALYINSIDKSINMDYDYMNQESLHQFILSDASVYRNAVKGDDKYKVRVSLTPSMDMDTMSNGNTALQDNMKVLMMFDTGVGHYIELTYIQTVVETNSFVFEGYVETDDLIHNNKINITNLINRETNKVESRMVDMVNPKTTILSFFKYDSLLKNVPHTLYDVPIVKEYTLTNVYSPMVDELYFAYSMKLMKSTIKFNDLGNGEFDMSILNIPLFASSFIDSKANSKEVLDKLVSQHRYLTDVGNKHTSNYSIDMKFYNTYGRSRFFTIEDGKLLDRVNCTIHFKIKYNEGIIAEDYIKEIKVFIKKQIEDINGLNSGINEIHVSNLITEVQNKFRTVIKYMQFVNINKYDSGIQSIVMKDIDPKDKIKMIPEYLTIREEDIILTTL